MKARKFYTLSFDDLSMLSQACTWTAKDLEDKSFNGKHETIVKLRELSDDLLEEMKCRLKGTEHD